MAATLQDIDEAGEIAVDISVRVLDRVSHPGLRCEMNDARGRELGKQAGHANHVRKVELPELEPLALHEPRQS